MKQCIRIKIKLITDSLFVQYMSFSTNGYGCIVLITILYNYNL